MASFLGNIWFGCFLFVAGYIGGHIVSLDKIKSWIKG
jgi:hypothetical protein